MSQLADLELERQALGACILRPELLLELPLAEHDFASDAHRKVWNALLYLHAEGERVGTDTLHERLSTLGQLDRVGGHEALLSLTDTIPEALPPTKRLRELSRLRTLQETARKLERLCAEGDLERATAAAADLQVWSTEARDTRIMSWHECATRVLDTLTGDSQRVLRIHPGLRIMADVIGSLAVGSLTIIGADTNVGKSSIAMEMLVHAAERTVRGGYVSREDPESLIGARALAMLSGISARRIEDGNILDEHWSKLTHALMVLERYADSLVLDAAVGGNELDVCATMTRMAQRGVRLVAVDYAQIIELSGRREDRRIEVAKVASRIKAHGARMGQAVVLLSQLTIPEGQEGKEPKLHWLKESRDLGNMAEKVILAWREQPSEWAPVHLKYVKGKSGGLGQQWMMQRNRDTGRLEEVA